MGLSPALKEPANAGTVRSGTTKRASKAFFITFSWAGTLAVSTLIRMRVWCSCSLYRIDQHAIWNDTSLRPLPFDTKQNSEDAAMDKDRIKGSAEQAKGAVKETAGKIFGDKKLETDGKTDKAAGKVQNAIGGLKDAMRGK